MNINERTADRLHKELCTKNHTDECAWDYEEYNWRSPALAYFSVWEAPTHKRWLAKAAAING